MEIGRIVEEEEITAWVPYVVDDEPTDAEVLLAFIPFDELSEIQGKATKRRWIKRQLVEEPSPVKGNVLLGRKVVRDWKGFTFKGKPFPYSPENCDLLMRRDYDFIGFVNGKCTEMSNFMEAKEEESKKK